MVSTLTRNQSKRHAILSSCFEVDRWTRKLKLYILHGRRNFLNLLAQSHLPRELMTELKGEPRLLPHIPCALLCHCHITKQWRSVISQRATPYSCQMLGRWPLVASAFLSTFLQWLPMAAFPEGEMCFLFFFFKCLFIFERERETETESERERGVQREMGRQRILSRLQALSCQRRA